MGLKFSKITIATFIIILLSILASIFGVFYAGMCSITTFPGGSTFCDVYIYSLIILYLFSILGIIISLGYWVVKKIKSNK